MGVAIGSWVLDVTWLAENSTLLHGCEGFTQAPDDAERAAAAAENAKLDPSFTSSSFSSCTSCFFRGSLKPFMALGPIAWRSVRDRLQRLLAAESAHLGGGEYAVSAYTFYHVLLLLHDVNINTRLHPAVRNPSLHTAASYDTGKNHAYRLHHLSLESRVELFACVSVIFREGATFVIHAVVRTIIGAFPASGYVAWNTASHA